MRHIIINYNQLSLLREFEEEKKVLHYEFENKVRKYMEELMNNPCHPKYDGFFKDHNIPEDVLQNRMLDLGLIKKSDKITEPEDANGKKHSVHTRKYVFSGKDFDSKIDKLYDSFFKDGVRLIKEDGEAGTGAGMAPGGATTMSTVGDFTYDVPFGGVQRRKIDTSGSTKSNVDMTDALDRTPGKIAVNTVK